MEHLRDWLVVMTSKAHLSFFAGMYLTYKRPQRTDAMDDCPMGDNLPHIFLKNFRCDETN
ncbi:MAG: hypothetical protein NT014_07890 [Candidatus Omnitrophica bacterium]|nr:hypothetical protein [Candidatus Omnitrophota bacterium]